MSVNARRIVLFLIGLFLAVAFVGYGTGTLRLGDDDAAPQDASLQGTGSPSGQQAAAPTTGSDAGNAQSPILSPSGVTPPAADATTGGSQEGSNAAAVTAPSFDILRVEPDGSTVVAGTAAAGSSVELVSGSVVLGQAVAGPEGAFAIVLDQPLDAGDHSLVLRASGQGGVATSMQTAIVSVPKDESGQVLAMVEQPGQPSRLITVPEATAAAAGEGQAGGTPSSAGTQPSQAQNTAPTTTGSQEQPGQQAATGATAGQSAATTGAAAQVPNENASTAATGGATIAAAQPPATGTAPAGSTSAVTAPAVEAIEIEGSKIFVAGRAAPGSTMRIYADEMLLGEVTAGADGRFLLEGNQELPVGSYSVRVDVLGPEGSVTARAAVPFEREPGENVAAVAPADPAAGSGTGAAAGASTGSSTGGDAASAAAPSAERLSGGEATGSGSAETTTAPALKSAQGAVIIRRGDSLWRISRRAYGQGVRYSTIYLANQDQIQNPNRIWPGQVFRMPETTPEGDKADMNNLGDQATTQP